MSTQTFSNKSTELADCGSSVVPGPDQEHRQELEPFNVEDSFPEQQHMFTGGEYSCTVQLPPELLCKVFNHLCNVWPIVYYRAEGDTTAFIKLEWAVVTHVCHRCTRMGSHAAREITQSSISVKVPPDITAAGQELLVDVIFLKPERLKDLSVSLQNDAEFLEDFIELGLYSLSAPSLESLVFFDMPPNPITLDSIMQQGAPRLQRLELEPYMLPWTHPLLNNLTILRFKVRDFQVNPGLPSEFLDALDRMPGLEHLTLHLCFPSTLNEFTDDRVVKLHHLVYLEVMARPGDCEGLFKHVAFPSTAFIVVTCTHTAGLAPSAYIPPLISSLNSAWFSVTQPYSPDLTIHPEEYLPSPVLGYRNTDTTVGNKVSSGAQS
ncbi:hypothetical protein BJ165DRAFT_223705 [Panaeolus papilionaceus]|nr:hypothetical protein BJ165DRAFT_223705 [Panaeolus papilionaceus]